MARLLINAISLALATLSSVTADQASLDCPLRQVGRGIITFCLSYYDRGPLSIIHTPSAIPYR